MGKLLKPRASARHSKVTVRWGSPGDAARGGVHDIVGIGRRILGGVVDLDPCTEAVFEPVIGALRNYSLIDRGEDGLKLPWCGRVWCNPPGGLVREFWEKGLSEDVDQIFWVGFSVEQLGVLADATAHPMDFSCCVLRQRIPFKRHDGYAGSPSHANYVCGLMVDHVAFERELAGLGKVTAGKYAWRAGR